MRFFGYYAWHSFINQLKKLFKTWVMVFIVCCVAFGAVVGGVSASVAKMAEEHKEEEMQEGTVPEEAGTGEEESFFAKSGLDKGRILDLAVTAIILLVFILEILSADKSGGKIFLPADVNLLFSSPLKPQSVLLFRLLTQVGTMILASFYMIFQIPNLVLNAGFSVTAAVSFLIGWLLLAVMSKMAEVFVYVLASSVPAVKKNLSRIIYIVLILLFAALFIRVRSQDTGMITAVSNVLSEKWTRYVPLIGWVKGFVMYAYEGNTLYSLAFLVLSLVSIIVLILVTWRLKADFYEDAMQKSEETAAALEKAREEKSGSVMVKRKKDRSDKLKRDGMKYGQGANVFFFKSMYNRFRFAKLYMFTKTCDTYLFTAIGGVLLFKLVFKSDGLIPLLCAFCAISFFRAMGNPLEEDTKMDYFMMIPENTWAKMFYSLLGGITNTALDMLPALVIAVIAFPQNALFALLFFVFALTLDFYASSVGTFIDLSVGINGGKMIKQIVQIMFIYFGLGPDILFIALGMIFKMTWLGVLAGIITNLSIGGLFFALSPLFIDPRTRRK